MEDRSHPDRRRSPRFQAVQTARLIVLREFGPQQEAQVTVVECSDEGMGIRSPLPIAPGNAVRLDLSDQLLLGEVVHCRPVAVPNQFMHWFCGIRLEQGIFSREALRRLLEAVLGGTASVGRSVEHHLPDSHE